MELTAAAFLGGGATSGAPAAAALAGAFVPDFGACLRAVFDDALVPDADFARFVVDLRVELDAVRFVARFRALAVDLDEPLDFEDPFDFAAAAVFFAEAGLLRFAGFFVALELLDERDLERLLGFFEAAIPTDY